MNEHLQHERAERGKLQAQLEDTMGLLTDLTAAIEQLSTTDKRSNGA